MKSYTDYTRRDFLTHTSILTLGSMMNFHPYNKKQKLQLGVISYSFRSVPHDINQLLQFCIECKVNAIEMMGDPAEIFAGKPVNPVPFIPPPAGQQIGRASCRERVCLAV